MVFLPNSVPCGPRSTSTLIHVEQAIGNELGATQREIVEHQADRGLEADVVGLGVVAADADHRRLRIDIDLDVGYEILSALASKLPLCSSCSPVITPTDSGTFCKLCLRFCAVTTTSSSSIAASSHCVMATLRRVAADSDRRQRVRFALRSRHGLRAAHTQRQTGPRPSHIQRLNRPMLAHCVAVPAALDARQLCAAATARSHSS
jgi:hypothetical protein